MESVLTQFGTIFHQFQTLRTASLFYDAVVAQLGFSALQPDIFTGHFYSRLLCILLTIRQEEPVTRIKPGNRPLHESLDYSITLVTTPEPTVRPPSRIAKRLPSVIATVLPSSTSILTLSPGIHISTSPRRLIAPVTSVVRK